MKSEYLQKKKLPDTPGVYFFLDKNKKPIYIGKATSLADRVKSYFSKDLITTRGALLVKMLEEAVSIDCTQTDSVLEALLLEADLIKKFRPNFNTKEKDDKSFNCIVLTDEDFPQVLVVRKKDINFSPLSTIHSPLSAVFGPYTNGSQLKEALKIIRKIFPYRDNKCTPYKPSALSLKLPKPCFNRQIGLCPGVCTGEISKRDYTKIVRHLKTFPSGKTKKLILDLKKEMNCLAKKREFEKAEAVRNKIYAIEHINDISLIKSDLLSTVHSPLETSFRIEAYDIAHMSGKNMVGVMVAVEGGVADKNSYRKFNIKSVAGSNDTGALREILERRFTHPEWKYPDLIVVDGGVAQSNTALSIVKNLGINIPVVAVTKDDRHKAKEILGDENLVLKYKNNIIFANSEAHRFAIAFHKKKRGKSFLG